MSQKSNNRYFAKSGQQDYRLGTLVISSVMFIVILALCAYSSNKFIGMSLALICIYKMTYSFYMLCKRS
ncbi:hypothetical protein ACVWYN_003564 [Pedobacter sp. UYP24]